MKTMKEKIARAIYLSDPLVAYSEPQTVYEALALKEAQRQVQTALEAMLEPERKMLFAGSIAIHGQTTAQGRDDAHKCFRAMIRAAMEEE